MTASAVSDRPHLYAVPDPESTRIPPWSSEAEASVISAVLLDVTALPKVVDFLRPEHFYSEAHRRIYEACVDLHRTKEPIDLTTVHAWLRARGRLPQVGTAGYLAEVADASPAVHNIRAHAVAVHDCWRRRQAIASCQRIAADGYVAVDDVQAWLDSATKTLGTIAIQNPVRPTETCETALARILRETFEASTEPSTEHRMTGFPTGIYGIDRLIGGLRRKAKTTIAATTGVGKTTMAMQLAIAVAKQRVGVLVFSMELERDELLRRALAAEASVPGWRLRDRQLTANHRAALREAQGRLSTIPWIIDATPSLTIEQVAAMAKVTAERFLYEHHVPLGMIVLDYVQRLEPSRHLLRRERHEQIGHATRSFKILCQELDIVGLELAQAKDGGGGRTRKGSSKDAGPTASASIADSSQIAKESDDVIFLVPQGTATEKDPRLEVNAIIAKQRAGAKGTVSLMFRGDIYKFTDPNTPQQNGGCPSRQYVDTNPLTEGL